MIAYFEKQIGALYDAFTTLSEEAFNELAQKCTRVLNKGNKIIASGLGKNVPICEKFAGTMNSLGLDARFLHANNAVHGDLGMVRPGDLVLLLSKSGNTTEAMTLAERLLERGTDVWLLSFNQNSRLSPVLKNKIIMRLENEGDPWDIVPNNSTTAYLMLLQGLAVKIAETMGVALPDFKINHPGGGIGEKLRGML
jgi:arabinose-5-phosphate isomerase